MITGIHHINLLVPEGTLDDAVEFYGETLGLKATPVPHLQRGKIAWFNIGESSGQQVHIAFGKNDPSAQRHPCFRLGSLEDLQALQRRIYDHHQRGGSSAPMAADKPGEQNSGAQGVEYPSRFFARDYAGNRLEFTV